MVNTPHHISLALTWRSRNHKCRTSTRTFDLVCEYDSQQMLLLGTTCSLHTRRLRLSDPTKSLNCPSIRRWGDGLLSKQAEATPNPLHCCYRHCWEIPFEGFATCLWQSQRTMPRYTVPNVLKRNLNSSQEMPSEKTPWTPESRPRVNRLQM
jgi:hypothetical protein